MRRPHCVPPPPAALPLLLLSGSLLLHLWLAVSQAQVTTTLTPDGTLGTAVTRQDNVYAITGGTRPGNGPNLFHSFDRFSVGTGDIASFRGPQTGITHILSRVTGGQRSDIDGTLRSEIPGAHLYLLNPAGVLFGPNASLDVSGSFHVSTADYLRLADGARFSARLSDTTTLSVAPPAAFGFLGPQPASLGIAGSFLQVPEAQTLSVIGGEVQIVGGVLVTPGGRIEIASAAAAGEVIPAPAGQAPDLQVDSFTRLGGITLSNSFVDASGNGGGLVLVRGGRLLADNAFMLAYNLGTREGTGLGVDAGITADAVLTNGAGLAAYSLGTGRARDVRLTAGSVHLEQGTQIGSITLGPGHGGMVRVTATDTLTLVGTDTGTSIVTAALGTEVSAGSAGSVVVEAPRVALTAGAQIGSVTFGPGQGGSVRVTATDTLTLAGTTPNGLFRSGIIANTEGTRVGAGSAGSVVVEAPRLLLTEGAQIASSTIGPGQGGSVRVTATDTLTLVGRSPNGRFASGIIATAEGTRVGAGGAGSVVVEAPRLLLTEGAQINSSTIGPGQGGSVRVTATDTLTVRGSNPVGRAGSGIFANAQGTGPGAGNAGSVIVEAPRVALTEGAHIASATFGPGQGGTVQVTVTDTLTLTGTSPDGRFVSSITTDTQGTGVGAGNAGSVVIEAPRLTLTGGAQIASATFGPGQGGTVQVTVTDTLTLTGTSPDGRVRSGIIADALGIGVRAGSAGSVVVEAPRLALIEGAQISSSTFGSGRGGMVLVAVTDTLTLTGTSPEENFPSGIFASALGTAVDAGSAGSVVIEAPRLALTAGAQISSSTLGPGQGGSVQIMATDALTLTGTSPNGSFRSGIFATTDGTDAGAGDAGAVVVAAHTVRIADGAQISSSTLGPGQGGTVTVTPADALTITGRDSGLRTTAASSGRGGDIAVDARQVQLTEGGVISAESSGSGNAGSVTIAASETFQGMHGSVSTAAKEGRGGAITITAASLIDLTATEVSATVTGGSQPGGDIVLTSPTLTLTGGRLAAETTAAGAAGGITLNIGTVVAQDATLTSSSTGAATGDAGTVTIRGHAGSGTTAHTVTLTGSTLQTMAEGTGMGGAITVAASEALRLDHTTLSATVANGSDILGGTRGDVTLTAPTLAIRGGRLAAETTGSRQAGAITLNVGQLTATEQAQVTSSSTGLATGAAGTVTVQGLSGAGMAAGTVILSDSALLTRTAGTGRGGDVVVETGTLTLTEGARLDSSTQGNGAGGTVTVRADATIALTGPRSGLFTETASAGAGGSMVIETGVLQLQEGAQISAASTGTGKAGGVQILVRDTVQSRDSAVTTAATAGAAGGDIVITAQSLIDLHASDITASVAGGSGTGGNITLTTPILRLEGGALRATTAGAGKGGTIAVEVGQVQLTAGARIDSSTTGAGAGGTVTVTATDPVLLTGADIGVFTRSAGAGQGGDILLTAPRLTLSDGASLSAESTGQGNAGNIALTLHDSFVSNRGSVVTRATQADGGNITLTAPNLVRLRDSAITAEVGGGAQTVGGNISIDPQFVLLQNSQIVANAFAGQGGTIRIQAQQVFLADPTSRVSASSTLGIDGQVNIQAPVTSISGTVAPLPQSFAQTTELLRNRCVARLHEGTVSSLVERGRDGVPASPEGLLPSRLTGTPPSAATSRTADQRRGNRRVAHQGGLQRDATGQFQITAWPTPAAAAQVQEVECAAR